MFKVGDIVKHRFNHFVDTQSEVKVQSGVILKINQWVDKGAPDRNFGVTIDVLWPDGTIELFDETEIDLIEVQR